VTKAQAISAPAAAGGGTNHTAGRAVAMVEDNRRPREGYGEVRLPQ